MRKNTKATIASKAVATKKQTAIKPKSEKIKVDGGFEILTNIPIPEETSRRGVKSPFRKSLEVMKIGHCFDADEKLVPKHYHGLVGKLGIKIMIKDLTYCSANNLCHNALFMKN